ncbi:MAG: tetratricopeptide repeat protein, partial [Chloroflexales bacterium]|nr:tetratricopeptide repeat protein [Chloroflexales bacterium]
SLTWLGVLWMFAGIFNIIGVITLAAILTLLPHLVSSGTLTKAGAAFFQPWLLTAVALYCMFDATLYIAIAMGLWRYRPWAYVASFIAVVFDAAQRIGLTLYMTQNPVAFARWFGLTISPAQLAASMQRLNSLAAAESGRVLVIAAIFIVLTAVNYRLFFGKRVRIAAAVPRRGYDEHFNTGLRYRDKGMWYMAAREWEAALVYGTADADQHRALGLCYAQLGEFGRAIRQLHAALALDPADARLRDDLATVERATRQAGYRYAI